MSFIERYWKECQKEYKYTSGFKEQTRCIQMSCHKDITIMAKLMLEDRIKEVEEELAELKDKLNNIPEVIDYGFCSDLYEKSN